MLLPGERRWFGRVWIDDAEPNSSPHEILHELFGFLLHLLLVSTIILVFSSVLRREVDIVVSYLQLRQDIQ